MTFLRPLLALGVAASLSACASASPASSPKTVALSLTRVCGPRPEASVPVAPLADASARPLVEVTSCGIGVYDGPRACAPRVVVRQRADVDARRPVDLRFEVPRDAVPENERVRLSVALCADDDDDGTCAGEPLTGWGELETDGGDPTTRWLFQVKGALFASRAPDPARCDE